MRASRTSKQFRQGFRYRCMSSSAASHTCRLPCTTSPWRVRSRAATTGLARKSARSVASAACCTARVCLRYAILLKVAVGPGLLHEIPHCVPYVLHTIAGDRGAGKHACPDSRRTFWIQLQRALILALRCLGCRRGQAIGLGDRNDVGRFNDAALDGLQLIAGVGQYQQQDDNRQCGVRQPRPVRHPPFL